MPETKGGRGYSRWQPVTTKYPGAFAFSKALERSMGVWRLFRTATAAKVARSVWAKGEAHFEYRSHEYGDGNLKYHDKGRSVDLLEIVEITLVVSGVHQD